jgi:hypothetical protein
MWKPPFPAINTLPFRGANGNRETIQQATLGTFSVYYHRNIREPPLFHENPKGYGAPR